MGGIIWLASYPKSGNTWARTFLHNLLLNPDTPVDINTITNFTLRDGSKSYYETVGGKTFDNFTAREVAALIPKVHEHFTKLHPDSVFVKTHSAVGAAFGVPLITLDYTAGGFYFVRNPLDVAISFSHHLGVGLDEGIDLLNHSNAHSTASSPDEHGRGSMEELYGTWSDHVSSWLQFNQRPMHIIRYEDMLEKPMETFGGMASFLGLNPPAERLAKAIKFSSFDTLAKQEKEKGFNEQAKNSDTFFRAGKSGQWKDILTEKQVDKIINCHHALMKRFGYLPK